MKAVVGTLLLLANVNCFAQCHDVAGVVKTTPIPFSGETDLYGCANSYPLELNSNACVTQPLGFYLSIEGKGNASFRGTSEITTVPVAGEDAPSSTLAYTPLLFLNNDPMGSLPPDDSRRDLQGFSSQAILAARFRGMRGTLYTKDTGIITRLETNELGEIIGGGFVGQIVKIVGGDGDFIDATGLLGVTGQEVGGPPRTWAEYTGTICLPDDLPPHGGRAAPR